MSIGAITRFAPSPTGLLHIGGARTALFNWLYAKHTGGKMLLRIEDTDRTRSTKEAITAILDGLQWLGIDYSGEVIFQSARIERHVEIAQQLLEMGSAYHCYSSPKGLKAKTSHETQPVVRLKASKTGNIVINDLVRGKVVFPQKSLDDFVLLRSNGTPTYMLAVVVDDHDMEITHIIRGDDHLTNTAHQKQIYDAMGWSMPTTAHIPLIHGPDGSKLSKRHGALGISSYRSDGFLPNAILNYLARLGWSHGNDEIFSMKQAIEWFDPSNITKSAARFDLAKLEHLNAHYIRHASAQHLVECTTNFIDYISDINSSAKWTTSNIREKITAIMPDIKERSRTLHDIVDGARFMCTERPIAIDQKASKILNDKGRLILSDIFPELETISAESWSVPVLRSLIVSYTERSGHKLVKVAQPLRSALTGHTTSIGIFEVMNSLGRQESLDRIMDQLSTT